MTTDAKTLDAKYEAVVAANVRLREERDAILRMNWQGEALRLQQENHVLRAELDEVRKIHRPVDAVNYHGGTPRRTQVCAGCGTDDGNWQTYPCPTIRALGPR